MGKADDLKLGDWNAICDVCGFKFKASQLRKRWDNAMVCAEDFEHRHPMDFFKGFPDDPSVPWSRADSDADTNTTDINGNVIQSDHTPEVYGDESPTYTYGALVSTILTFNTALSVNRTLTIGVGTEVARNRLEISRTAGGAGTLDIGGVYTIPALKNEIVVIEYDGANWRLISNTPIGL